MATLVPTSALWTPLSPSQNIDAAVSTALTIPAITAQAGYGNPGLIAKGAVYGAILTATLVNAWVRFDGQAASVGGGLLMIAGDQMVVLGLQFLKACRLFRASAGGSVFVQYFYYKPETRLTA